MESSKFCCEVAEIEIIANQKQKKVYFIQDNCIKSINNNLSSHLYFFKFEFEFNSIFSYFLSFFI